METLRAQQPLRRLLVRGSGRLYAVRVDDIDWIEAAGHYLEVHAGGRPHLIREAIGTLERRLDPATFVRIHRSTIVNVERIRDLQPSFHGEYRVTLLDGHRLRCSRPYAARLTSVLGE